LERPPGKPRGHPGGETPVKPPGAALQKPALNPGKKGVILRLENQFKTGFFSAEFSPAAPPPRTTPSLYVFLFNPAAG